MRRARRPGLRSVPTGAGAADDSRGSRHRDDDELRGPPGGACLCDGGAPVASARGPLRETRGEDCSRKTTTGVFRGLARSREGREGGAPCRSEDAGRRHRPGYNGIALQRLGPQGQSATTALEEEEDEDDEETGFQKRRRTTPQNRSNALDNSRRVHIIDTRGRPLDGLLRPQEEVAGHT
mmetsp:Transcript_17579/g.70591  ORF Transcript_17579/g.70591 Transcript_17579/m.70591 type:complete len:180 (+) Transcript_17579:90-629(+)